MEEKKVYKCKYCGKEFDDHHKRTGHMMHCEQNPNRVGAKKDKKPEKSQDIPPKIEDIKQPEEGDIKEEKLEEVEKPKSSLQEIGEVLRSYGITDGETLMRTIDEKARQMPFYAELSSKVEALTELRNLIAVTNKAVNGLVPKLDAIQRAMSGVSEQASNVQSLNSQAQQMPAELTQEQMQQMQMQQPQMQPQREGLSSWFDRLLALLQLGSSQENQSQQPPPSPEELKYKEIVNLANVLKELQGDPHKQFERDMKLFIDLAKVFRNIPTNSGSVKVKPKSKTEELEE